MALLRRKGSIHAIDGKYPDGTSDSDKEKIEGDELSVIQLSLVPNVLHKTTGIEKNEETLAYALLFSLTSKYRDIENSLIYRKNPITLEQVWKHLTLVMCGGVLKDTKMMKLVGSL
ncbi:hypothetical protein HAX54_021252 [Datura stramonium]|uniref:Uncharacterized protein n=1 Tax=Datura stramonium TaxID=4076 RepID=A0ABS8USE9_DATST|nr:hypothetical protein [Datura stramonium]